MSRNSRCLFFFYGYGAHRVLHVMTHSFPTRCSSDLFSAGRSLRPGDSGSRVADLRHALASLGFTESVDRVADGASDIEVPSLPGVGDNQGAAERAIVDQFFDDGLRASVNPFQIHSGLAQAGIAGPATRNALNGDRRLPSPRPPT